jgi:hypothetical protein
VRQKVNIAGVLEQELRKPAARHYRVFMASATDPYQPAEASACLTQRCLAVLRSHPVDWLVVQTRSLLVQRDFALLAELPFATLNVSIETDLLDVHRRFTRSSASPERRLTLVRMALARGIFTQITVSPLLPSSPTFAETLALAVGEKGCIIIDTFLDGDGSGGQRSARLGMDALLADAGFPGWFTRCREHARELQQCLLPLLGPERVLWSAEGFRTKPALAGVSPS